MSESPNSEEGRTGERLSESLFSFPVFVFHAYNACMTSIRVGVLRGGPSNEYDVSLKTGASVLQALSEHGHLPVDIFIDKKGAWHIRGISATPADLHAHVDVVFNALHGAYGEDGEVQRALDAVGVPYTGSGAVASALAMHKGHAKDVFTSVGIPTPPSALFKTDEHDDSYVRDIFRSIPSPYIVKPVSGGSSIGMSRAHDFQGLHDAIAHARNESPHVLIESLIHGREATCGVIDNFRGEDVYALLPIEIVPPAGSAFFDYDAKYSGATTEICPGRFSREEMALIQEYARKAHKALGARHYSRSDFIVTPKKIFILETNTLPGLTAESLVPKALSAVGCTLPEFVHHLVTQAVRR